MNLNAAMDFMIENFLLALFIIHSVTSDKSQMIEPENVLQEYTNTSILSVIDEYKELKLQSRKMKTHIKKIRFSTGLLKQSVTVLQSRVNTTKQIMKMLYDIENVKYSMKKSLQKANNPETLEDLLLQVENSNELEKSLNQLQMLKIELYKWIDDVKTETSKYKDIVTILTEFSDENSTEVLPEINLNDSNNEKLFLKFDIDLECDELEKLRRLSLMVQDELNEMPKSKDENSESKTQNTLPEVTEIPRWLLNEKDIEDIRDMYISWMLTFTYSEKQEVKELKEKVEKSGQSIKAFCKTLSEYCSLTSKLVECTGEEDAECEEIIHEMMNRQHFKEFIQIFMAWVET